MNPRGFILYRIFYGDELVYLGRTKQPLQDRIRGHLFKRPMHRNIDIELVSKIEYAEFKSEADMNVYEVYFINLYHPMLNRDDKASDGLTFTLPDAEWKPFNTPLWDKWQKQIIYQKAIEKQKQEQKVKRFEQEQEMRKRMRAGEITRTEYLAFLEEKDGIAL
jgi:hypothetical protein